MLNLSKIEYLLSLSKPLKEKGFFINFKEKPVIYDSYIAMTVSNKTDYFQIKIKRYWFHYFGNYSIIILCSNIKLLDEIETVNELAKTKTGYFNSEKKKFHNKLQLAITTLRLDYKSYISSLGGINEYKSKIQQLKEEFIYAEKLTIYDFISPAIGLEIDENGVHPVFGIAVGGDRSGGLILFDPFEGELEVGSYIGFGNYGTYESLEFNIVDSISNIDISWDWDWD